MFYIFYKFSLYKTRMQILDISICSGLPCDIMVILSILLPCGKEKMMMICNLICEIKSSFRSLPGRGCLVVCETEKPKYSPYLNIVIWIKILVVMCHP